jgi:GNAT superfamily N-acetyltransferase
MVSTKPLNPSKSEPTDSTPNPYQSTVYFDDAAVEFRTVRATDVQILGDYFQNLSAETKRRYGPHPFDRETAKQLCESTDPADTLRMVAILGSGAKQRVIAYFILILGIRLDDVARYEKLDMPLQPKTDCTLAPSVADDFQAKGLGSTLMERLIENAKTLGRTRMVLWGGTQATNDRAIHFYHKHGFRTVGEFQEPLGFNNYDMILDL